MVDLPEIGSIWVEDYDYRTGYVRKVRVVGHESDGRVTIVRHGGPTSRRTKAKAERFGRKGGYLPAQSHDR